MGAVAFAAVSAGGSKDTLAELPIFDVYKLKGLNTSGVEFCPIVLGDKLVFVSEREIDYVNLGENNYKSNSYLSIQYSNMSSVDDTFSFSKPKLFSNQISKLNHSGPITFNSSGSEAFFTRVHYFKIDKKRFYRPQIFSATFDGKQWKSIELLNFNQPEYSFGHPSLSSNAQYLYFVSDMEGGFGGKDVYKCQRLGETWSEPVNLGSEINTSGDEVFPFLYKDSLLFFSSNGHPGLGGLDLFYSVIYNGLPSKVIHLDESINSVADDFGIFFNNSESGYVSSNRSDGAGRDDIYGFSVNWYSESDLGKTLAGIFEFRSLPGKRQAGLRVYLINEDGEIVFTTETDKDGAFTFVNLPYNQNYTIRADDVTDVVLLILDDDQNIVASLTNMGSGEFVYKKLSLKELGSLQFLYETDTAGMVEGELTKSLGGMINFKSLPAKELGSVKILLMNEAGIVVFETMTSENGAFKFENLPHDENFLLKSDEYFADLELLIMNGNEVVARLTSNEQGEFVYVKLPHTAINSLALMSMSEGDEVTLYRGFDGKSIDMSKEDRLAILAEDNQTAFVFSQLEMGMNDLAMMGESSLGLCPDSYDMTSEESDDCIDLTIEELLAASEIHNKPVRSEANAPVSKDGMNIYFNSNSSYLTFKAMDILDELAIQMKSEPIMKLTINAHSDDASSDNYNLWLSERRGTRITDYLIGKEIDSSRLSSAGFGETRPAVICEQCTPEEQKLNRRAEIVVSR